MVHVVAGAAVHGIGGRRLGLERTGCLIHGNNCIRRWRKAGGNRISNISNGGGDLGMFPHAS